MTALMTIWIGLSILDHLKMNNYLEDDLDDDHESVEPTLSHFWIDDDLWILDNVLCDHVDEYHVICCCRDDHVVRVDVVARNDLLIHDFDQAILTLTLVLI